jgi:hypothetical protein
MVRSGSVNRSGFVKPSTEVVAAKTDEGRAVEPRKRRKVSGLNARDELMNDPHRRSVDALTRRRVMVTVHGELRFAMSLKSQ